MEIPDFQRYPYLLYPKQSEPMFVFRFKEVLEKNNLKVIFMIFTDGAVCPGTGKLEGDLHDIYR